MPLSLVTTTAKVTTLLLCMESNHWDGPSTGDLRGSKLEQQLHDVARAGRSAHLFVSKEVTRQRERILL